MKRNGALISAATLIFLSALPQYMSFYNFINNGSLSWSMEWGNEQRVWALVFSSLNLPALILVIRSKEKGKRLKVAAITISTVIIFIAILNAISSGIGQSSKSDVEALLLVEFWRSGWWS